MNRASKVSYATELFAPVRGFLLSILFSLFIAVCNPMVGEGIRMHGQRLSSVFLFSGISFSVARCITFEQRNPGTWPFTPWPCFVTPLLRAHFRAREECRLRKFPLSVVAQEALKRPAFLKAFVAFRGFTRWRKIAR